MPSPINLGNDGEYWDVFLGPIPGQPSPGGSAGATYQFPNEKSARAFALVRKNEHPYREVRVETPGGGECRL